MNEATLEQITAELKSELTGQKFGKIFLLSRYRLAIDFRLPDSAYLFLSIEPSDPRIYLIKRRLRDLEEQTRNLPPFLHLLRNRLSNSVVDEIEKLPDDRVIRFSFSGRNDVGQSVSFAIIAQLTGRSANLFLTDEGDIILDSLRQTSGPGQETAGRYAPPFGIGVKPGNNEIFPHGQFRSLSEALDASYSEKEIGQRILNKSKSARTQLKREISKRKQLVNNLRQDQINHGHPDQWKRFGDLLLANLATAQRSGTNVLVTDYYDENLSTVEIEIDDGDTLSEAAEKFFKLYTKARNAQSEISKRLEVGEAELAELALKKEKLEKAIEQKDENALSDFAEEKNTPPPLAGKSKESFSGTRKFTSSDGFEILVGRRSKDNDYLTFRIAKSLDLWLHAADYPGSHVVVRNPNRREIPPSTLIEAAQIAAYFSRAKSQPKAAVNYTQKKFVNKPKGAAPGMVSLASFKTILVEPQQ